jgi:quinol monooxygenase YgiN
MITFITHLAVRPENAAAFEAIFTDLAAKIRQHEPGVTYYGFGRSANAPDTYMVIEVYRDEAAIQAHAATDYLAASMAATQPLVEPGSFDVRQYVSPGTAPVHPPIEV